MVRYAQGPYFYCRFENPNDFATPDPRDTRDTYEMKNPQEGGEQQRASTFSPVPSQESQEWKNRTRVIQQNR